MRRRYQQTHLWPPNTLSGNEKRWPHAALCASEEMGIRIGILTDLVAQMSDALAELQAYHRWMHSAPKSWDPRSISWHELQRVVKREVRNQREE